MPSKISRQYWAGGEGAGDRAILIGYCKESPEEVLQWVCKDYYVHHYKDLYCPIDDRYPNNVEGLIIEDTKSEFETNFHGCDIFVNNSIADLNIDCVKSKEARTFDVIEKSIERCRKFHLGFLTRQERIDIYNRQLDEVMSVISKLK